MSLILRRLQKQPPPRTAAMKTTDPTTATATMVLLLPPDGDLEPHTLAVAVEMGYCVVPVIAEL